MTCCMVGNSQNTFIQTKFWKRLASNLHIYNFIKKSLLPPITLCQLQWPIQIDICLSKGKWFFFAPRKFTHCNSCDFTAWTLAFGIACLWIIYAYLEFQNSQAKNDMKRNVIPINTHLSYFTIQHYFPLSYLQNPDCMEAFTKFASREFLRFVHSFFRIISIRVVMQNYICAWMTSTFKLIELAWSYLVAVRAGCLTVSGETFNEILKWHNNYLLSLKHCLCTLHQ